MTQSMFATCVIFAAMLLIIASLGYGLYYLLFAQQDSKRLFNSLSLRVSVSLLLVLSLIAAIYFGWITPNPPQL